MLKESASKKLHIQLVHIWLVHVRLMHIGLMQVAVCVHTQHCCHRCVQPLREEESSSPSQMPSRKW